jgi:tRNA modification GTPase
LLDENTIVAIATANGIGSISIIRVSGKDALPIALKLSKKENLKPRLATLSSVYNDKNEVIDEALLIYFKNPFSFTGEDIVEFQCHGGVAISNIIMKEVIKCGARVAQPGEFSKRAFLNGKIDLTKAEAIAKIIEARSEDAVKLLARQLKGELTDFVNDIREDLLFMLAYTEVNIDYAEDDGSLYDFDSL